MIDKVRKLKRISNKITDKYSVRHIKILPRFLGIRKEGFCAAVTEFVDGKPPVIKVDILFILFITFKRVKKTIKHEIAHVINFYKNPQNRHEDHGNSWMLIAKNLGLPGEAITQVKSNSKNYHAFKLIHKIYSVIKRK